MKRLLIVALATCFMLAMGTGLAFADTYNVTADFGKRVTEQGVCEEVGAVTISVADIAVDQFFANQTITMELLGSLEVCNSFYAVYNFGGTVDTTATNTSSAPGADQYSVTGNLGQDFVSIAVGSSVTAPQIDPVMFGHDTYSRLCVDLSGTLYTASDPVYQLLQASYSGSLSGTFSGDQYIATVKSRTVFFDSCTKGEGTSISANGYSDMDYKDDLVSIELCYSTGDPGQDQIIDDCGEDVAYENICLRVSDSAVGAFASGETYEFTIGKTAGAKACVGIADAVVYYGSSSLGTSIIDRRTSSNIPTSDPWQTSQIRVQFTAQGPGTYYVRLTMGYDTCCATPGPYMINFTGRQVPCGGSFSFTDQTVANFVSCDLGPMGVFSRVIPYGAETATSGWYNGLVFTNPTDSQITIDCMIYEEDGDPYTGTVVVGPMGMVVGMDTDVLSPVSAGSDAVFGDESYAIYASAPAVFHCFMINFDLVQAQGYLAPMDIMRMGF